MVAEMGAFVLFVAVNEGMLPEPLAPIPMATLELVHAKVAPPGLLVKLLALIVAPAQTLIFAGAIATTPGDCVTVTELLVVQPLLSVITTV